MSDLSMPSSATASSSKTAQNDSQITEAEAAVYDRQIRLWGLEAQQRMRSSTILVIKLRSLAAETIKNLVLAGIGKLIVMDSEDVSPQDLGAGFLFREGDGVVGKKRVDAALPQIQSLNPLVEVQTIPSSAPFLSSPSDSSDAEMDAFLESHGVDVVCVTDASRDQLLRINAACRRVGALFYGSGGYAFTGYIFSDLGDSFEYVSPSTLQPKVGETNKMIKKRVTCPTFETALASPPFAGLKKKPTLLANPAIFAGIMALWEYESKHGALPASNDATEEIGSYAESYRTSWGIREDAYPEIPPATISHLALQSTHEFAPTSAILGGMLAQDLLKALSRKETPILNFLAFDGLSGGSAVVSRWGLGEIVELSD